MYLEIFLADFAVFRVFGGISRDFAGPRPREISEALYLKLSGFPFLYWPPHSCTYFKSAVFVYLIYSYAQLN